MSLSVPQNGVKADDEPVIELFVKVRQLYSSSSSSRTSARVSENECQFLAIN